jgi:glycosyltransferase involved in cell wall biosynthesis
MTVDTHRHRSEHRDRPRDATNAMARSSPIRIGINLLFLIPGKVGGMEIYALNMLDALAMVDSTNEYYIFRNEETSPAVVPRQGNFIDCPLPVRATSKPVRIIYEQTAFLKHLARSRIDVLLNMSYTAPLLCGVPMMTIIYDLQYKAHPENYPPLDLLFWRLILPAVARRSKRIVAISRAAREQFDRYYPWCASKIDVIPHGIEDRFSEIAERRDGGHSGDPYILAVSTLGPHKNYEGLLRAYERYHRKHPDVRLIIVGIKGSNTEAIVSLRDELGLGGAVTFTGWIPRERLYELYQRASAFVYASKFEGLGIPVLEALAAGVPTACSAIPSLLEVAAGCARFFDPDDVDDIEAALIDVTTDENLRLQLVEDGRARSRSFAWEGGATLIRQALEGAARS